MFRNRHFRGKDKQKKMKIDKIMHFAGITCDIKKLIVLSIKK